MKTVRGKKLTTKKCRKKKKLAKGCKEKKNRKVLRLKEKKKC